MNPRILGIATFRALSTLFSLQGNTAAGKTMAFIADGIQSGADIDGHMRMVAAKLESDEEIDWESLHNSINTEGEQLQARVVEGGPDPVAGFQGQSGKLEPPGGEPAKQTPEPDPTVDAAPNPDAPPVQSPAPDPTAAPASAPVEPESDPNTTGASTDEPTPSEPVSTGMQSDVEDDEDEKKPAMQSDVDDEDEKKPAMQSDVDDEDKPGTLA